MLTHIGSALSSLPVILAVFGAIGLITAWLLVPLIISRSAPFLAGRREFHQTHTVPVPRFGGLALAGAFVAITAASFAVDPWQSGSQRLVIGVTSLMMFALGFLDDISPLGARKKLIGQILIAILAFYLGLKVETFKNPITGVVYSLGWFSPIATVFWLVALTNLINLIDGIDGLAGGISLMLMCLLAYVGFHGRLFSVCVAAGMAGALFAFLRFNFPPARIYLGDGGAYFLGYLIGGLTIQNSNKGTVAAALIAPIFALALPILDVSFSIIRRGLKGLPIFRPDRRHIHHRLLHAGWSRRRAVLTLYAISLVFLVLAFVAFWSNGKLTPILFGFGFLVVLLIVPNLGMIKNWFTVGTALGNSLDMRKEVQYALMLRNWIQMESERTDSVEALWDDFTLTVKKLGFAEAILIHRESSCSWGNGLTRSGLRAVRHDLQVTGETVFLDLYAPRQMEEKLFQIKGELLAETWQNAARRWTERNNVSFVLPATEEKDNSVAGTEGVTYISA